MIINQETLQCVKVEVSQERSYKLRLLIIETVKFISWVIITTMTVSSQSEWRLREEPGKIEDTKDVSVESHVTLELVFACTDQLFSIGKLDVAN